jgi:uncharacterized membrane protein
MSETSPTQSGIDGVDNTMLHVTYGLYALGFFIGIAPLAGAVIAYLQRGKPLNAMQQSHVEWQIRTFWLGLVFVAVTLVAPFVLGSVLIGILAIGVSAVWFVYRIAKGWMWLKDGRTIETPDALI